MAEKRMFTKKIIDSDAFLNMPLSAQALYFHLNMRADDDGFVNNPVRITDYVNASHDDLKLLIAKRFIIGFDSGVIVIKHWRMHNTLKNDRYVPTDYQEEYKSLVLKANKSYTEAENVPLIPENADTWSQTGTILEPNRNQNGNNLEPNWNHREGIDIGSGKDRGLGLDLEYNNNPSASISTNPENDLRNPNGFLCRAKDARRVEEAWNSLGLAQVMKTNPNSKRAALLRSRITQYGVDTVIEAIENIRKSTYLQGQNDRGWVITFDWFLKPSNFQKVAEGNYDDKQVTKMNDPDPVSNPDEYYTRDAPWFRGS